MSFGGSVSAMNQSLKANKALRNKRNYFKDKKNYPKWGRKAKFKNRILPNENLTKSRPCNEAYLESMKNNNRKALMIGVGISAFLLYQLYKCFIN